MQQTEIGQAVMQLELGGRSAASYSQQM